jgi:hypothetical protein
MLLNRLRILILTLSTEGRAMSGAHTIFDTRRLNKDDSRISIEVEGDEDARLLEVERKNSSAFLADRGELSSAATQYLRQ